MLKENMNQRLKIPLKDKELDKILLVLARQGRNAKKNLANYLNVPQSNVTLWLKDKFIPNKHFDKLHIYLELPVPVKKIG